MELNKQHNEANRRRIAENVIAVFFQEPDEDTCFTDHGEQPDATTEPQAFSAWMDRLAAFHLEKWWYVRLSVKLFIRTETNWAVPPVVGRAYLSGVESDSEQSYIDETFEELLTEAIADMRKLQAALNSVPSEVK